MCVCVCVCVCVCACVCACEHVCVVHMCVYMWNIINYNSERVDRICTQIIRINTPKSKCPTCSSAIEVQTLPVEWQASQMPLPSPSPSARASLLVLLLPSWPREMLHPHSVSSQSEDHRQRPQEDWGGSLSHDEGFSGCLHRRFGRGPRGRERSTKVECDTVESRLTDTPQQWTPTI